MLQNEDPEGLQFCRPSSKNKKKKRLFSCDDLLEVVSLDIHEKLCGYQNIGLSHWVCMSQHLSEKVLIFVHLLLEFKSYVYWKKIFKVS